MKLLLRGTDLVGLPVVTLAGDDIAEVRDVLFDPQAGHVLGFTLNKRGRLAGRLSAPPASDPARRDARGDVIADRVMTDSGVQVGTVTDVVIDTATGSVVGYEVLSADEPEQRRGRRSYLPLPETGAVSGEALIVPASAVEYIATDFAGFGEAIDRYRDLLRGTS